MNSAIKFLLVTSLFLSLSIPRAIAAPEKLQVIHAEVKTEEWKGWGGGEPLPDALKAAQAPEKFRRIAAAAGQPQVFSGKVLDLKPEVRAEVGIVSLIGAQWTNSANYEWFPLDATRSFSVTSAIHPEAKKALVVRAEGRPWTFLRFNFEPGDGAKDIEFHVSPSVKCVITMEDALGNNVSSFRGELFNAYMVKDDEGQDLYPQRFGHPSSANGAMPLDLPPEPVGILLEGGLAVAPYYAIIDPRQANHFHFKMIAPSRVKGVVTQDGKPAARVSVFIVNNAAPLSASARKTDAAGKFDLPGRVPGTHFLKVGSYKTNVEVTPGETIDLKIDLSAKAPATNP